MSILKNKSVVMDSGVIEIKIKPLRVEKESCQQDQVKEKNEKNQEQELREHYKQDIRLIKEKARQEGMDQGFEQGYRQGLDQFKQSFRQLEIIRGKLAEYKQEILRQAEPEIIKLAQYIAEKVIRQKINEQDAVVISCLNFALKQVGGLDNLIIRLNPKDYHYLVTHKQEIKDITDKFPALKLIDDQRVEKGGCIISTQNGDIDAQPSSQLKIMDRLIQEELYKEGKGH
ncbi:MAG: FliH/SctL family protein [Actinomycetota bacterium]|nr:FliH/SctL family protein [Actinomycetota bacterium]